MTTAAGCDWCVSARQLGDPNPDHGPHEGWLREVEDGLAALARKTTERLATERAARGAVLGEATERGACLTCLAASDWRVRPRYVKHRRADFHGEAGAA